MKRSLLALSLLAAPAAIADQPLPQSGVRVLLNDPLKFDKPMDDCGSKACKDLLKIIENAEYTIDLAFYGIRHQKTLFDAFVAAKERGVRVRGVVDTDANGNSYYSDTERFREAIGDIKTDYEFDRRSVSEMKPYDRDFERCERPIGFEGPLQCLGYNIGDQCIVSAHASREPIVHNGFIMHNKFVVADRRYVWTGSTNASDSGTGGYNANMAALLDSRVVAGWYTAEFEQMYKGNFHTDKTSRNKRKNTVLADGTAVELYFTPQDDPIEAAIRPLLQRASKSIDISVFFLTHKFITKDLIDAHLRGIKVRIIMDATGAKNGYTKHEILRLAGIPVKIENWGGKMHMKAAVVDGEHMITGSMNWTSAGERTNDENTLILHSKRLAGKYLAFYEHMWTSIPDRWLRENPDPESKQSGTACTDGVDNDFDHDADSQDRGCEGEGAALSALPPVERVDRSKGHKLIKGVMDGDGNKVFVSFGVPGYNDAYVDSRAGEKFFCSEMEAEAAGWKPSWR